ncbi:MAG: Nif3-like dinuclear metal center hexameric protein, partial [Tepidisphaeraceae bacterium]
MKLKEVITELDQIAPPPLAQPWDNVGLIVGDVSQVVSSAMLTIDYSPTVACEAAGAQCNLIIAYHPPIFQALKRVRAQGESALIFDAIKRGVAIYSPHTALDVAHGGTNDVLADVLELRDRRPLKAAEQTPSHYKLVTFVPSGALDKVSAAIFAAGAGRIGNYSSCGFA